MVTTFKIPKQLNTTIPRYELLTDYYHWAKIDDSEDIIFDFSETESFSHDMYALLGALCHDLIYNQSKKINFKDLNAKMINIIGKNNFGKHLGLKTIKVDASEGPIIKYQDFNADVEGLIEFEKYISLDIFHKFNISYLTTDQKCIFIDNLLEIFNNVIDHTQSEKVYVCGNFNAKDSKLHLTLVNIGQTIKDNVAQYFGQHNIVTPHHHLEWAIKLGNSTKVTEAPGGLGMNILNEYIKQNNGEMRVYSDDEYMDFQYATNKCRLSTTKTSFPGVIVSVTINLNDIPRNSLNNLATIIL